jgi:2,3-dihydroxyphenylpropionate 1,2-dioxygenase
MMGILPVARADDDLRSIYRGLSERVSSYEPDLVVIFAPDHMNGFAYELMPPFCIGYAATSIGDYGTQVGDINVATEDAKKLHAAATAAGFDVAISYRMKVDHGCAQPLQLIAGGLTTYPIIPIFINAAAPPRPTWQRVRLFGEAVGRHFSTQNQRILIVASGGLSHDPPIPAIETASAAVREKLIHGLSPTPEARRARDDMTTAAAIAFGQGKSELLPLDDQWDQSIVDMFMNSAIKDADEFDDDDVTKVGGRGAHEVRTWLAAAAAQSAAGQYDARLLYRHLIPEWIVGMGIIELTQK